MSEKTLEKVAALVKEVIGEEWVMDEAISMDTSFGEDLELESIEFVALAEKLQETYGNQVNFVEWLSTMNLDQIISLRVGDLVGLIEQCQSTP